MDQPILIDTTETETPEAVTPQDITAMEIGRASGRERV